MVLVRFAALGILLVLNPSKSWLGAQNQLTAREQKLLLAAQQLGQSKNFEHAKTSAK